MLGAEQLSLLEIEAFLTASDSVRFVGSSRMEIYHEIGGTFALPSRVPASGTAVERAVLGLYRAHSWLQPGAVHAADWWLGHGRTDRSQALAPALCFQRPYTAADVELLASVEEARERLSGPAARHTLKREFEVYGKSGFERLARLWEPQSEYSVEISSVRLNPP